VHRSSRTSSSATISSFETLTKRTPMSLAKVTGWRSVGRREHGFVPRHLSSFDAISKVHHVDLARKETRLAAESS
jgi:hypothetical protein